MTAVAGRPLAVRRLSGVACTTPSVVLPPVPLWLPAGATIVTFTSGSAASAVATVSMPGASYPSSLVTRISSGPAAGDFAVVDDVAVLPSLLQAPNVTAARAATAIGRRIRSGITRR